MGFVEITGNAYTDLLRRRLTGELAELTWVQQFREILSPYLKPSSSIVDFGCATGYAYKAFRSQASDLRYYGLDFEEAYLSIAREYFATDSFVSFIMHDIAAAPSPIKADIAICSATLEHAPSLLPALKHMADAAGTVFVLRTFLSPAEEIVCLPSPLRTRPQESYKYNNAYAFTDVLRALHDLDFRTTVRRDAFTDSLPHLVDGLVRTFYILVAERPSDPKASDPRRL
jgi:SAM-dependent methyltransferase